MKTLAGFDNLLGKISVGMRKQQDIIGKVNSGVELNLKEKAQYKLMQESEKDREESLKKYSKKLRETTSDPIKLNANMMFELFKNEFEKDGKKLILTKDFKENLKTVMLYFLKDARFFNQSNLLDKSIPDFDKGLLIIGAWGNGKSTIMKTFHEIFKGIKGLAFHFKNSNDIVSDFEKCKEPEEKKRFFFPYENYRFCFDDILTEKEASNYGKSDLLKNLLETRCNRSLKTFVTCNPPEEDFTTDGLLNAIQDRYGSRVHDRFFEMFNIVEFKGKSFRK